jgi:CRP-like cAMP-binding protein
MSAPAEPGLQEFAANRLLALLPETECERIARHLEPSVLDAGHVLQHESTAIEHVYFPARGVVASTLMVPDAADVTVSIVGREGALFSDAAAPVGRSLIRATVRSPGMAWRMPLSVWRELVAASPSVSDLTAAYNALCVGDTQQNAACCLLHDVESRVCRWLLHVHDRLDGAAVAMTHADLASFAGTRRTTVTLIAGSLESAGIIDHRRGKIEVIDRFALEATACECYGTIRSRREEFERRFAGEPADINPSAGHEGAEAAF